ncbi:MAG: SDR family NAD(P)-dependent oxidoreductase [Planctomycetota bacterium]|nr:SDR family NAD(P)-dependent oxidoreductase [Planctomycetota bacterium]
MSQRRNLRDMVVVITGASAGIGKAVAEMLSSRGAKLVLAARRADRLDALNGALGGKHLAVVTDVAKRDDCERLIARSIAHFGRIDTLVCNAGYGYYRLVADTSPDDVRKIFATNVFGTTDCIAAAVPHLLAQSPRDGYRSQVMIVSSAAARRSPPYLGVYGATKAAQLSIAEAMRVELRPKHIAVTSVHPIMTSTEFGQVAEAGGDVKIPRSGLSQTVEQVAAAMIRAIESPRAEVWPHRISRWGLGLATLAPGLVDHALNRYRRRVEGVNRRRDD